MSTKVFFYTLRPFDEQAIVKDLAQQWGVEYGYTEAYPTLENAQLAAGYDAVSLTPCDMSAPMVQRFHDLGVKAICCRSIGYDHVDLEKARELGMKVSNVDYPPNGVANFAIMLMLMSLRKAGHILKRGEVQDYSLKGKIGRDISSCTVGVIGTGRIGQTVLKHLSGFGCSLLAYALYPNQEVKKIAEYVPLETLLAESDVITLHTNATEENHHLLDAAAFAKMKPGVTIVNTARGKLIDSDALLAALESGQVGAAGLDVLENENGMYYYNRMGDVIPNPELAAFRAMPNVILTDHTAFYTYEDVKSMVGGEGCTGHAVDLGAVGSHNLLSQLLQSGTADALGLACALQLAVGDSAVSFHSQGGNDVAAKALAGAGLGNAGSSGGLGLAAAGHQRGTHNEAHGHSSGQLTNGLVLHSSFPPK